MSETCNEVDIWHGKEKLSIKNFAGLKEVQFQPGPVTGLIGPQASGKSITAKLLYFFREIASRLPAAVIDGLSPEEYNAECRKRFFRYFPVENTGQSDFEITYRTRREQVRLEFTKTLDLAGRGSLRLEWSGFYTTALEKFALRKQELLAALREADKDAVTHAQRTLHEEYDNEAGQTLGPWSKYEQIFIPAGRAFFSQFRASVFTRLESGESLDPFMVAFGSLLEQNRAVLELQGFFGSAEPLLPDDTEGVDRLRSAVKDILGAEVILEGRRDFIQFDDGRLVELAQASSGQQEALPLLLLLARFLLLPHWRGRAVYVEEPEAHLFPSTQKLLVELMARAFREREGQMCLVITTHSPYILTSINNLLQAGKLYATASHAAQRKLFQVVPPSNTLKPGEVAFFALENGGLKSILDPETGLIDGAAIDQVSNDIAVQFDKLLSEAHAEP